ncbi:hypothetical protein GCM10007276_01920 [Agaricicola taiwanensis]|uniref:DUF2848 domain-containing protein n=1 Tax=Agaricicola taiwanensis TaxID=591372 RepID=A0A8J2YF97_9RHOB|nr:DUF2848 domain-containing protein [Agaricicola taiwanensis]GGE28341.1 hypothetical protein GCM10007276_01920 [Agaricicola taiwanensis]
MKKLELRIEARDGSTNQVLEIGDLVIAGWAARDKVAMEHHIAELEALGVARPKRTPTYYRVSAARLTTDPVLEATGTQSSGEVEPVLLAAGGRLFVGVGSDHTDRDVETYGVTVSKQMCDKPVAGTVWPFEEVRDHWDQLILRSFATIDGRRELYQEGPVAGLLAPVDIIAGFAAQGSLSDGTVMFGGTLGAIGGIRPATRFEGELEDPVLGRSLRFGYDMKILPIEG